MADFSLSFFFFFFFSSSVIYLFIVFRVTHAAAAVAVDIVLIAHVHRLKLDDPGRVLLIRRFRSFCRS